MADEYVVVRYQVGNRDEVFAFLRDVYPQNYADQLIRQWDWKYAQNPFNRDAERNRLIDAAPYRAHLLASRSRAELANHARKWAVRFDSELTDFGAEPYILLLRAGSDLVGIMGSIPQRLLIDGVEKWAGVSCDWVIHPKYRGLGLAPRLSLRLSSEVPMEVAWRNEQSNSRGTRATPLNASESLAPHIKRLGRRFDWKRLLARRTSSNAGSGVTVTIIERFGEEFDEFWQRAAKGHAVIGVRDRAYLTWRFCDRPDSRYTVLAAREGNKLAGYLVSRVEESATAPSCFVVDFLVAEGDIATFTTLVQEAEKRARREGAKKMEASIIREPYAGILRELGFRPAPMGPRGAFWASAGGPEPHAEMFRDLSKWFVTMGDGDLEMSR